MFYTAFNPSHSNRAARTNNEFLQAVGFRLLCVKDLAVNKPVLAELAMAWAGF